MSQSTSQPPIELEPATGIRPRQDARPRVPEPLPVRLVAVADVHLPAAAGREVELDAFYVELFGFERDHAAAEGILCYHAENHALVFDVLEPPIDRDTVMPTGIEVPNLRDTHRRLIERETPFERLKGITPGDEYLLLQDPAGNWLTLTEMRVFG